MISIVEVKTPRQRKAFIDFPLRLYKDCSLYNPPLYMSERNTLKGKVSYFKTSDSVFYLAYKNGKLAGRISGIIVHPYNEKNNVKQARFTRFDCIDDQEVSAALFKEVESWARGKGMEFINGPLDYSDVEREGLLIEGFDQEMTFEEQYHFPYYQKLIENNGYFKDVDWIEFKIFGSKTGEERLQKLSDLVMRMNHLHLAPKEKSKKAYINKYKKQFFHLLDVCYGPLYGTVPFTQEQIDELANLFAMILDIKYMPFVLNEKDEVVAVGLSFPGIANALKRSKGKLTLPALLRLRKEVKHPKTIDLGIIAVLPEYQNKGVPAVFMAILDRALHMPGVDHLETNLNLEYNHAIISQWKRFEHVQNKRRRCYKKIL